MKDYIEMSMNNFLMLTHIGIAYLKQRFPEGFVEEEVDDIRVRIVKQPNEELDCKYSLMISLD